MTWVDILVLVILALSFLGGVKNGAVKSLFSLAVLIAAIFLAGMLYYLVASLLTFLSSDWRNFLGFFVALGLISAMLHLILLLPRKLVENLWGEGPAFRIFGGAFSLLNASAGLVVFALVLEAYPIMDWPEQLVANSAVISWLVAHLGFLAVLLPDVFQKAASSVAYY